MRCTFIMLLIGCLAGLNGCRSAQAQREDRIEEHRAAFDSLSPQQQEQVRAGAIDLGFTTTMVRIARGNPEHVFTRITPQGRSVIWTWVREETISESMFEQVMVTKTDKHGVTTSDYEDAWVDREIQRQFVSTRIEFAEGRVVAIESLELDAK